MQAPAKVWPWRLAAGLVLLAGFGAAIWVDPALLDRGVVKWPLVAVFAVLWMMPTLRDKLAKRRNAAPQGAVLWQDEDRQAGRGWLDTALGLIAGLLGGALVLSFSGAVKVMSSGPDAVNWAFDVVKGFGLAGAIGLGLLFAAVFRLATLFAFRSIKASRFIGGIVIGLCLWVPFHASFAAAFARIGVSLPGLQAAE